MKSTSSRGLARFYLFPILSSVSALVNRTIDDVNGDSGTTGALPVYLPTDGWALGYLCGSCNVYPAGANHTKPGGAPVDAAQTFDGTWHDTTQHPGDDERSITVNFVGQAVYVFNIIANELQYTSTETHLTFTLDGMVVGQYSHLPNPEEPTFLYRVPVYTNAQLSQGHHTLVISVTPNGNTSLVLFDYIEYTTDDESIGTTPGLSPPSTMTSKPTNSPPFSPLHAIPPSFSTSSTPSPTFSTSSDPLPTIPAKFSSEVPQPLPSSPSTRSSTESSATALQTSSSESATNVPESGSHGVSAGVVAGGAVAGVLGFILPSLLAWYLWRRYRWRALLSPPGPINAPNKPDVPPTVTTTDKVAVDDHENDTTAVATFGGPRTTRALSGGELRPSAAVQTTERNSTRARFGAKLMAAYHPRRAGVVLERPEPMDLQHQTGSANGPSRDPQRALNMPRSRSSLRDRDLAMDPVALALHREIVALREEMIQLRMDQLAPSERSLFADAPPRYSEPP